jgi:hypothetical protein
LRDGRTGAVFLSAAVIIIVLIFVVAMMWYVSMGPTQMFWSAIEPMMPDSSYGTMQLVHNVSGWTLIVLIGGLVALLFVYAYHRESIDYPMPIG